MTAQNHHYEIQKLPAFPQVALDLFNRLQSTTSTNHEIAKLINSDASISSKVLKLANSGYYSIPGGAKDVGKALQYLGFNTVSQIVLTSSVPQLFRSQGSPGLPMKQIWKRNLAIAVAAETLAQKNHYPKPAEAFTVGLLCNVGKLAFLEIFPMNFDQIQCEAKSQELNFDEVAVQMNQPTTHELTCAVAEQWNFPSDLRKCLSEVSKPGASEPFTHPLAQFAHQASKYAAHMKLGDAGDYRTISKDQIDSIFFDLTFQDNFQQQLDRAGAFLYG